MCSAMVEMDEGEEKDEGELWKRMSLPEVDGVVNSETLLQSIIIIKSSDGH